MTTATTDKPRKLDASSIAVSVAFIPRTGWPLLEECRERHERAREEMRDARREEALLNGRHRAQRAQEVKTAAGRVLDGEPRVDPTESEEARRRELAAMSVRVRAAQQALRDAVYPALRLVAEHPEWREQIAGRRAAALAEREDLLRRAEAAKVLAHSEENLARWLEQAATKAWPQPFRDAGPPPPPPATVQDVFGHTRTEVPS